jgi:hypothetical protein
MFRSCAGRVPVKLLVILLVICLSKNWVESGKMREKQALTKNTKD